MLSSLVSLLLPLLHVVAVALAVPTEERAPPIIQLDNASFVGTSNGVTNKFLGIPFAKPPVGNLRFNLPVAVDPYTGSHTATSYGPACPQQAFDISVLSGLPKEAADAIVNGLYSLVSPSAEDCLSLNVIVPAGTKPGARLPVAVWIFGGGFELGGSNTPIYNGDFIVKRSIALKEPVIFVSMNYRVSAFGFLASKEVKEAGVGNLGLLDQRLAFRWVQKYISAFGGDPTKVTIWGESAGAISVALHLVTNGGDTEGLFRGAFMQSGSTIPVGDIEHGQADYDTLVAQTGCAAAADTLQCLRELPFATLKAAVDNSPGIFSPQSLRLAWLPRVDGKFLTAPPLELVLQGEVADVPLVTGNCDDEGTLFSLSTLNITTEQQVHDYIISNYINVDSPDELDPLWQLYPADPTQGSPFNTGYLNALTPQYKRLAAIQGDLVFQAPRRFFLQERAGMQPTWSYLNKRLKALPAIGSAHGTDLLNVFGGGDLTDRLVHFVSALDPNGNGKGRGIAWPRYTPAAPVLLNFVDDLLRPQTVTVDDHRVAGMGLLTNLSMLYPL